MGELELFQSFKRFVEDYNIFKQEEFLAQMIHESGGFRYNSENLNYSSKKLLEFFPWYFRTEEEAKKFAYKPVHIANRVYGGRMGNTSVGDGFRYRGRGYIQLTGKTNYMEFNNFLRKKYPLSEINTDVLKNPGAVGKSPLNMMSAAYYWETRKLDLCKDMVEMTKVINGGLNGLDHRLHVFQIIKGTVKEFLELEYKKLKIENEELKKKEKILLKKQNAFSKSKFKKSNRTALFMIVITILIGAFIYFKYL